jgi:hypothetical protein
VTAGNAERVRRSRRFGEPCGEAPRQVTGVGVVEDGFDLVHVEALLDRGR